MGRVFCSTVFLAGSRDGLATATVPIQKTWLPRFPLHSIEFSESWHAVGWPAWILICDLRGRHDRKPPPA